MDEKTEVVKQDIPLFSADSAYSFIEKQIGFGPRVPNTKAHDSCAAYLFNKLKSFGANVSYQTGEVKTFDGKTLKLKNIVAKYGENHPTNIMIMAHWDSRPWADRDPKTKDKPVLGADDGASGVAVALELARQLQKKDPGVDVIILLDDAEDYGSEDGDPESWCLGTQHWIKNYDWKSANISYGILLDMVGGKNAHFVQEGVSVQYAQNILDKVWSAAGRAGFSDYFLYQKANGITDDHTFINQYTSIPCIDIVNYYNNSFPAWHHTIYDTLDNIDKSTLNAVGNTLMQLLYEKPI